MNGDSSDLQGILQMLQAGPTEAERQQARSNAMMRMGLGILAANQPGPFRKSTLGLLGAGGLAGMDAYQNSINQQALERRAKGTSALQALQIKKEFDRQDALAGLLNQSQPSSPQMAPVQLALAQGASMNDIGPTVTNAARLDAAQQVPPQQNPYTQGYQPIPLNNLAKAATLGANIDPFLKLNEQAQPKLSFQNVGNELIGMHPITGAPVTRTPMRAAPASIPFEASDQTAAQHRQFLLDRANAGAMRAITNVNAYTPASEAAQAEFMKSTRATYDTLKQAPVALESIEKAKALIPSARGFMGPGGEGLLDAAKFLNNRMGMSINTEGVKNAEELRTRIFFNIMDNLKKMDAQPSQQQQQIMQEALGKLGTDPNALPQVLDAFGDVIKGKVALHNREVSGAIGRGVKFPYDPIIELRAPRAAQEGAAPTAIKRYNPATGRIE